MIAAVLGWAIALTAPGSVAGLAPAYEGTLLDSGTLILRDAIALGLERPPEEIAVFVSLACEPLVIEDAIDRWSYRWKTTDAFTVRDARSVIVTAEDEAGPWPRPCRVSEVWSCYLPHSQMWIDASPDDGGLDEEGTFAEVIAAVRVWSGARACTRARFVPRRGGGLEVRT